MNATTLNGFLAQITSFGREVMPSPPPGLDWEELCGILERQGLAAIASYQLDYRFLARVRPPPWARERLLLSFNAQVNDNVLKVTHLRRLLSEEGVPPTVLLGAVSVAESFYPHIAFRPLECIDLWVQPSRLSELATAIVEGGLSPGPVGSPRPGRSIAARFAHPDLDLQVWRAPPGLPLPERAAASVWERSLEARVFGPAARRLDPADALCARVASLALHGFAVPRIDLIDLREMILRCDGPEGFYAPNGSRLIGADVVARSRALGLDRSLWTGLRLAGELFPEAAPLAKALAPRLPARVRALLEEMVVRPALDPHRSMALRAVQALRRFLLR